jgi:sugar phosphate isomerase/epimerase
MCEVPGWGYQLSPDRVLTEMQQVHPHVGTMVETGPEVQRVLEGSSIALCLDTGHLPIGGTDPAELARQVPDRWADLR